MKIEKNDLVRFSSAHSSIHIVKDIQGSGVITSYCNRESFSAIIAPLFNINDIPSKLCRICEKTFKRINHWKVI